MEAIQGNEIIIFSRLYVRKSRELNTLQSKIPTQPVVAEPNIASVLQAKIDESERYLNHCDKFQTPLVQARIAFLQSELMAEQEQDSEHYWDNISLRLLTIIPAQVETQTQHSPQDEDISLEAAAQLLEVPDYLDDYPAISKSKQMEKELQSAQINAPIQQTSRHNIEDLHQQVQDRELVIEQLQQELEALREQILRLQDEIEAAPSTGAHIVRVFEETDEPDRLLYQIECLTDLLLQKSEQLATLQSDLSLTDDAFDNDDDDDDDAMHYAIAQQKNSQMLLPELDNIVHPSDIAACYELTPEQQAMIEQIEDIDLDLDDQDLANLDELGSLDYLQSNDDTQAVKDAKESEKPEEDDKFDTGLTRAQN